LNFLNEKFFKRKFIFLWIQALFSPVLVIESLANPLVTTVNPDKKFIKRIEIVNHLYISQTELNKLVTPYTNTFLSEQEINNMLVEIKAAYMNLGFITVNPYIIDDLEYSDRLKIRIKYGFVEEIILNKNSWQDRLRLWMVSLISVKGNHLNIKSLELIIDQLNTLSSSRAKSEILPGKFDNGSILRITDNPLYPYRIDIGCDNLGEKSTGKIRYKTNLDIENILSLNEAFSFNFTTNYPTYFDEQLLINRNISASATFSLSNYTFSISHNKTKAQTPIIKPYAPTLFYKTQTHATTLILKRPVFKTRNTKISMNIEVGKKQNSSSINDILLEIQSTRISPIVVRLNYSTIMLGWQSIAEIAYHQGTKWWKATTPSTGGNMQQPNPQFKKFTTNLTLGNTFLLKGVNLGYQIKISQQYTPHILFDTEQISLSGMEGVRGLSQSYKSNNGFSIKNEITFSNLIRVHKILVPLQSFFGLDFGYSLDKIEILESNSNASFAKQKHYGWATGIRYSAYAIQVELTYAAELFANWNKNRTVFLNITLSLHQILKGVYNS
jgi:hemolysin activation/secretion protein